MSQLVLGTAQFGDAYGVTNALGRLSDGQVKEVLETAIFSGVVTFDTAADYGDSQDRLGRLAPAGGRYITKFSLPVPSVAADSQELFGRSMGALGVTSLAGVMFHKISDLTDDRSSGVVALLREARTNGVIDRMGVSIYDEDDLAIALEVFPDLDLLQFPGNIVDRRLLDSPRIAALRERGVELHVRSAFLQGLLLADPATLAPFFAPLAPLLEKLSQLAARSSTSVLGLVLRYLRDHPAVDGVVVGATTSKELEAVTAEWNHLGSPLDESEFELSGELLDPRRWPRR